MIRIAQSNRTVECRMKICGRNSTVHDSTKNSQRNAEAQKNMWYISRLFRKGNLAFNVI